MADENIYRNTLVDTVSNATNCGVVTISVSAAVYISSQQCKECWIYTFAGNTVYVNFNGTAAAGAGFTIGGTSSINLFGPMAIANLSAINVYSAGVATVCVVWRG